MPVPFVEKYWHYISKDLTSMDLTSGTHCRGKCCLLDGDDSECACHEACSFLPPSTTILLPVFHLARPSWVTDVLQTAIVIQPIANAFRCLFLGWFDVSPVRPWHEMKEASKVRCSQFWASPGNKKLYYLKGGKAGKIRTHLWKGWEFLLRGFPS